MEWLKILIIVTSCAALGPEKAPTGMYLEEFTTPYYLFVDAGFQVEVASPAGGAVPVDPRSIKGGIASIERYQKDPEAQRALLNSVKLSKIDRSRYVAIFLPGGHGTMGDFPDNKVLGAMLSEALEERMPVGAVCHGPAALLSLKTVGAEGRLKGRKVAGFTNEEEAKAALGKHVPFLLEDELERLGAVHQKGEPFASFVVVDGKLVTGQNPASSEKTAKALLKLIEEN